MISIYCKNTQTDRAFPEGTTLLEALPYFHFDQPYPIVSAKVNNVAEGLKYRAFKDVTVEFVNVCDSNGMRVYGLSLCFLLAKAVRDLFPDARLYFEHPVSNGYYCNLRKPDMRWVTRDEIKRLVSRMKELVADDLPYHRHEVHQGEAADLFASIGLLDKLKLVETCGEEYAYYYTLDDMPDYYYSRLLPSTRYLTVWGLEAYQEGMLLRLPDQKDPDRLASFVDQPKTFAQFSEILHWNIIMGLNNAGDVNQAVIRGRASELIQVSEALQEKKIVRIAEYIDRRFRSEQPCRVVLVTGPSGSGKTTFCRRLGIQLKACGLQPLSFSTDDYFVNRVDTPKLPDGSYDFDNFETVDHCTLERDVISLLEGEEVEFPEYDFVTGRREYKGKRLQLKANTILVIEGIHALNPMLLPKLSDKDKYKVFVPNLTSISLDDHNWIPTGDVRLLRRVVRDASKGAFSARETITQWPNVCSAEEKWITPFQEEADAMFNSSYLIEFAVLCNYATPILESVPKESAEYCETHRLLHFMHYFVAVPDNEIPSTSLLREFLGGSSFKV